MRLQLFSFIGAAVLTCMAGAPAIADDGEINNKSMSRTIKLPEFDQDIVNNAVPEAEHAFTDMMPFYVPAQAASGAPAGDVEPPSIEYNNIDGTFVESLPVAKPLINVFLYGPAFHVEGTAFSHSFFDTYAAVSLDDGVTWKQTNLSNSADLSSFNLDTDYNPKGQDPLPNDHTILLGDEEEDYDDDDHEEEEDDESALHARGFNTPYSSGCTECHGVGLQGTAQTPSCYSCHGNEWREDTPVDVGPIITRAVYDPKNKNKGTLTVVGENAARRAEVSIINGITGDTVGTTTASRRGNFSFEDELKKTVPCIVAAKYTDETGKVLEGPAIPVVDKETGDPIENCVGLPLNVVDYPGGTYNVFHATAGNKVLVAWPSRFCQRGQPAYQMTAPNNTDTSRLDAVVAFLQKGDTDLGIPGLTDFSMDNDLYLKDVFGVRGAQGSINFADEGYPQAGVVPFGCVWTARGILLPGDDPRTDEVEKSHMVWTQAERLTSGRRDPNRIEVKAVKDAGFVITWQEDPDGLRPGQGLGPGEGWSGAVAHSQTDVWYSFINYKYFDLVESTADTAVPVNIMDHDLNEGGRPQVFVPMAVPMRLTNNAKCNAPDTDTGVITDDPYCDYSIVEPYGLKDQCAGQVTIITGPANNPDQQKETLLCVADTDGIEGADLPNRANTAATRPRTSLQGYTTSSGDKSAWVIVDTEESKGLGKYFFEPDGLDGSDPDGFADPCEEDSSPTCSEEIGKNQWYFSFDMGTPDTSAGIGNPNSLVENLVNQGNMLNQPEVYWQTGEFYGLMDTEVMGLNQQSLYGEYDFQIANTEIARRASLLVQSVDKAVNSTSHLAALPSWKQGTMRQGGPADTMVRRIVLPEGFDPTTDNPYAFANMECENWLIPAGTNPYYPGGLCADPAINLSSVVPDTCINDGTGEPEDCPTVDFSTTDSTYGVGSTNPILQGVVQGEGNQTRVLTWHQCPSDYTSTAGDFTPISCDEDNRTDIYKNLRDQSWYNPLDVSKGHRGFIDGDFVMFLYAWSPNWRLNAKGNDRYELYVRRSFDGGQTWGTTPSSFTASDGVTYQLPEGTVTVTCETYRPAETGSGDRVEPKVCYTFPTGTTEQSTAEHARNVTQHRSMRITTLDPRYAPTPATITDGCTDGLFQDPTVIDGLWTCDDQSVDHDSDLRNPSRYFMVFETGDNRTVQAGEAEPLDLYYSRAERFGDNYVVWTETDTDSANPSACYPNLSHGVEGLGVVEGSGFCNEFDRMNRASDTHSSEANLETNPAGTKMYGVWAQWVFENNDYEGDIIESDAMARRIWWIDDYVSETQSYTLPGTQQPTQ